MFYRSGYYLDFDRLRKEYKICITEAYINYVSQTEVRLTNDPKSFWKYIRSKKNTNGFPLTMRYDSDILNNASDVCWT